MRRRWVLWVFSAALALVTTLAIVGYLQGLRRQAAVVTPVKTEAAVFARTNVAERKVVSADTLELRQIPATAIHPRAARRIEDVAGRVAVAPIFADEQVLTNKLAAPGVNVGLSYALPKDKRAMTIAVNEVIGVAGFVFPGDRVDVVATVNSGDLHLTKVVLQDVEVLAIAQKVEQKPGEEPRVTTSATLALTPEQTEIVAQVDTSGRVRLALRPYGVNEQVQTAGATIDTAFGKKAAPAAAAPQPAGTKAKVAAARTAVRPRPARAMAAPLAAAPTVIPVIYNVELWRATAKSTVQLEEGRRR